LYGSIIATYFFFSKIPLLIYHVSLFVPHRASKKRFFSCELLRADIFIKKQVANIKQATVVFNGVSLATPYREQ